MLRRPATAIALTLEDLHHYDARRKAELGRELAEMDDQHKASLFHTDEAALQQIPPANKATRAAQTPQNTTARTREQRIGISPSRESVLYRRPSRDISSVSSMFHTPRLWVLASLFLALLPLVWSTVTIVGGHEMSTTSSEPLAPPPLDKRDAYGSSYWYANIKRQGVIPYGNENSSSYVVWRNVRDYGAQGDGVTDDTDAINSATYDGYRCTYDSNCSSETTTPAIIYFPAGTYIVSKPLIMLYYTQFVGDATDLPTIKGTPDFYGIALLDSDPYLPYGYSWWQNQNNFWRHVRNFILDITDMPTDGAYHGLHWQVAQGTSVQNVVFNMVVGAPNSTQFGIFMDNGSGGWYEDLIFNGGGTGLFAGNQQWTSRNLTFNDCQTAIYQNWNWVFNYKSLTINNCDIGLDLTQGGGSIITTGSIAMLDSTFNNVGVGVLTTFASNSTPVTGGTLVLDNVNFIDTPAAVASPNGTVIVPGNTLIDLYMQGRTYSAYDQEVVISSNLSCFEPQAVSERTQGLFQSPGKPASLLNDDLTVFERAKPQYVDVPVTNFVSIRDAGCSGDGVTDETTCVQNFFDSVGPDQIAFIDHGAYVISDTINVPTQIKMVGEIWPLFMVDGSSSTFSDMNNPKPAFKVGNPGDVGAVEMSEIIFETIGPAPGAIMMEWNLFGPPGANGMWDVHWRMGGTNGTQLQLPQCEKQQNIEISTPDPNCIASFLLVHITSTASVLMSNNWGWVADHELDLPPNDQISLYNGRGLLVESQGPVWLYGSAFEHSMLYNYNFANTKDLYAGILQSETAYMQGNPDSLVPFSPQTSWSDPTFDLCYQAQCYKTWGLRIFNSTDIVIYGMGLYSFFDNYDSSCLLTSSCQENMVSIEQSEGIWLYALSTKGATNMVQVDGVALVPQSVNMDGFCDTLVVFEYP